MSIKDNVLLKKEELRRFCTYRLIFGISYSLMIPIIPLFFESIGITTVMIGTIISFYGLSKTFIQIPFGIITDKIGDKLTIIIALLFMACVPFAYTLTNNQLVAGSIYIVQGAILGMAAPATYSVLSRCLDTKRRGESTGLASAVFTFGGGIGAAIAGYIVTRLNNYNLVFYIASIGIIATVIYLIFRIPRDKCISSKINSNDQVKKSSIREIFQEIGRNKLTSKIIVLGSISFLGDFIYSCVIALFHFYGRDVLGASTEYTSAIISIYLLVFGLGAPLAGWVSDKIGNKKQLFLSFVVMNVTLLGLVITRSIPIFTIIIIMYFLGATFLNAGLQSSLSEFGANDKIKGIVFGIVGASESLGYAVGPLVSAYVYQLNKSYLFLVLLIVSIIISAIYVALYNKSRI